MLSHFQNLIPSGSTIRLAAAISAGLSLSTLSFTTYATESDQAFSSDSTRPVIFVGNNWEGSIDVIDSENYVKIGRINGIPDKHTRMAEIIFNPFRLLAFQAIRLFIGEGHDQLVDDMYSTQDGRLLIISRPSYGDVVGIDIASNEVEWRFRVKGIRSDHMAISPDGTQVAVSASTGNVVHILDVNTGEELGQFPSGDSPHENVYSKDGSKIYHASIGKVYTPLDVDFLDFTKGKRRFQVVDTHSLEILKQFDMADKLSEAGLDHLSPAVRPMAHTPDERMFYFQLSFLHGFVEYDMQEDKITRLAQLPNLVPDMPITQYVNDSAHHGIAMNGDGDTLCVAGTMDDYVALVDRETFNYQILTDLGEKPYWVTSDKTGENCYISWSGTDQMSVINYESGEEVVRIDVGDHPQRIREGYVPVNWTAY
ncbi:serine/threonine protein kinase [Hahella sp. CCB-MM4]|uniref:YncE family protein n=1 Tax=Hahella sp. (strain CCB-MM4) TaxID=1926491 RepID=UPI000B9B693A|nr:serine/threonine protein kinase [Hahella sp. CCB-MM4]OZG73958.1 serine/threonine protein kinase [Hahella sp. CCB-MM4]